MEATYDNLGSGISIPDIKIAVDSIKWLPFIEKIYITGDRVKGTYTDKSLIHLIIYGKDITRDNSSDVRYMLEESLTLLDIRKGTYWTEITPEQLLGMVLLYEKDSNLNQNEKYEILEEEVIRTLYSDFIIDRVINSINLIRYLPFIKEVYYFKPPVGIKYSRKWEAESIAVSCPTVTEEEWDLLERVMKVFPRIDSPRLYRIESFKEDKKLGKFFENSKVLIAKRS